MAPRQRFPRLVAGKGLGDEMGGSRELCLHSERGLSTPEASPSALSSACPGWLAARVLLPRCPEVKDLLEAPLSTIRGWARPSGGPQPVDLDHGWRIHRWARHEPRQQSRRRNVFCPTRGGREGPTGRPPNWRPGRRTRSRADAAILLSPYMCVSRRKGRRCSRRHPWPLPRYKRYCTYRGPVRCGLCPTGVLKVLTVHLPGAHPRPCRRR